MRRDYLGGGCTGASHIFTEWVEYPPSVSRNVGDMDQFEDIILSCARFEQFCI